MNGYQFDKAFAQGHISPQRLDFPDLFYSPSSSPLKIIAGVDEVGRGPLAGPLVVAAVILPWDPEIEGLNDSKLLSPREREAAYCEIWEDALAVSVAVIDVATVDSLNILGATMHGMREALKNLEVAPDVALIDGNQKPRSGFDERTIVKGDQKSAAIMAASIIAKVTRDAMMEEAHKIYPHYGFAGHKGYGSEDHMRAIREYGPCPLHRRSFEPVKSMVGRSLLSPPNVPVGGPSE